MVKFLKSWKGILFALFFIFSLGFLIRIYNLTHLPVFGDEAIYIRWAQVMRNSPENRFVPLSDGKQPLFMWSVIPFLKTFSDPLFAGRLVSVLSGMGTLAGVIIFSYLIFAKEKLQNLISVKDLKKLPSKDETAFRIAIVAGLFYAVSPYFVFFDRMALVDSMLTMFGVWTFVFAYLTIRFFRIDTAFLTGFSLGFSLLTKSTGLFFALFLPMVVFLKSWTGKLKFHFLKFVKVAILFGTSYFLAFGLYNILRLGPNFHMLTLRTKDYVYPYTHVFTSPLDPLIPHALAVWQYFVKLGPGLLIIFVGLSFVFNYKKYWKQLLILTLFSFGPILAVSAFTKVMTARYVLFAMPYIFILAASSFTYGNKKYLEKVMLFGLALVFVMALRTDSYLFTNIEAADLPISERKGYLEEWTAGHGIKEVSEFLIAYHKKNPDEKIVVGTEGYFGTLPDGLQIYLQDYPKITVIGVGIDLQEVPQSLRESKESGNKTFLVINDTRLKKQPRKIGLRLISSYPKAESENGQKESLLFLELE